MSATCDCCSECAEGALSEPSRFSFIWVQLLIALILIFLMTQFMIAMFKKRKDILKYHDTISSFCACKHGWENRFLLIFTLLVSTNMLCMHFEEYNGRTWDINHTEDVKLFIIFIFEIICIVSFPLVGIFYTEGKHPDPTKHNTDYECPYGNCKIETSEKFHRCGAYLFMLGLCITSIMWGVFFIQKFQGSKWYSLSIVCMVWATLQLIGGIVFVILQIVLNKNYKIKDAFESGEKFRQTTQLDLELDKFDINEQDDKIGLKDSVQATQQHLSTSTLAEEAGYNYFSSPESEYQVYKDDDRIGKEQERYRLIAKKLRYISFAVEGIVAASIIALVTLNTIIRMLFNERHRIS